MSEDKYCETCTWYSHSPNILGGVADCMQAEKSLMTFWPNKACDLYKETKRDNLAEQNQFYKDHVDGALKLCKGPKI